MKKKFNRVWFNEEKVQQSISGEFWFNEEKGSTEYDLMKKKFNRVWFNEEKVQQSMI